MRFFHDLNHAQRRKWVINEKRCPLCLKAGHRRADCGSGRVCRFCRGDHNSCIHVESKRSGSRGSAGTAADLEAKTAKKKEKKTKAKGKEKDKEKDLPPRRTQSSESDEALVHSSRRDNLERQAVSLTTLVTRVRDPKTGQTITVNALADGGADHTILSANAARRLGVWQEGKGENYFVKGHGGSRGCYAAQRFLIELVDAEGKGIREVTLSSYEQPCGDLKIEDWSLLKKHWPHLRKLPLPSPEGEGGVDLILGSSALDLMEAIQPVVFGPPGGPVAKLTKLGWVTGGRTTPVPTPSASSGRLNFSQSMQSEIAEIRAEYEYKLVEVTEKARVEEEKLRQNLRLLWGRQNCCREKLRNATAPSVENAADSMARERFEKSRNTDKDGRPEVGLIWRGHSRPRNNFEQALRVYLGTEKRMKAHGALWDEFHKNVTDWVDKGYATMHTLESKREGFYIPTFMVVREDKSTTKYRLIVNGKFCFNSKSINDYLYSGPNVMNRLGDVLLRFRYHKYVVTCDVANMFLRVGVPARDRKFLRFLYRNDAGDLKIIEMCSHAFGLTQSPFVVINVVREHAESCRESMPLASKAVLKDSIVDDVLTGCKTYRQLLELQAELVRLYSGLQMNVHKWATNSPGLRAKIEPEMQAQAVPLAIEQDECGAVPSIKCLGIVWHPEKDELQFFSETDQSPATWTMRRISSRASRLFDPLGLMTPLLLEGKLVLQELWKLGLGWDDPVPVHVSTRFERWLKRVEFSHLSRIGRRVKARFRSTEERLVVFTDASSQAQAAAAYLWCGNQTQQEGNLYASKQRISSLNRADSISRLELEGAVLGIELAKQVCQALRWDMNRVIYFTDSTTVLWWLRTHRELDVFVGNRVCKILDWSNLEQWFHVRTDSNPADIPTRGCSGRVLARSELWWTGPAFFRLPRHLWPEQPPVVETRDCQEGYRREEKRRVEHWTMLTVSTPSLEGRDHRTGWLDSYWFDLVGRYANQHKGLRIAGWIYRYLGKSVRSKFCSPIEFAVRGVQVAVYREAQRRELTELRDDLLKNHEIPKQFRELRPFLDREGVVRVGGRLKSALRLPFVTRCPVLLDAKGSYAVRLLRYVHEFTLQHCGGKSTLVNEVRQRFWLAGCDRIAKKVVSSCVWCRRSSAAKPAKISIAPLHMTRIPLAGACAFSEIGLDMAGPFFAKQGRGRAVGKRFVLLFSCCWTRALNLEVVDSASTESAVLAFLRHCNVFGIPRYVNSDRGSNFVGMDRHLQEQWNVVKDTLSNNAEYSQVKWHFNPPYSPRFTGHVEVMVKVMKTNLKRLLGQPKYTFRDEELHTLIKVAQGYANKRPLHAPSGDPADPPALTPADFLGTGSRLLGGIGEMGLENYEAKTRKEMLGELTRELWEGLTRDYILALQRYARLKGERPVGLGDIVLLLDKDLPSGRHCLGRVVGVKTNPDGKPRTFEVLHHGKVLVRSSMTLAPLEGVLLQEKPNKELEKPADNLTTKAEK